MVLLWMHTKYSKKAGKEGKNQKQVHVWAAIEQNFKSNLTFYGGGHVNSTVFLENYT